MIRNILFILIATTTLSANAQTTIDRFLSEVEKNNKTLHTEKQYAEAQKLTYRTGLNPENPKAEYDYLIGSPANAGNQTDMSITQAFDFPTAYGKRKTVSKEQVQQAEYQFQVARQDVLFEAKIVCLELIQRNKLSTELSQRLANAERLLKAITQKMDQGEANILDLNKIKLLRLDIKNSLELNTTAITNLTQKLTELNGDVVPNLDQLTYPAAVQLPTFDVLDSVIEANDPVVKVYQQETAINSSQVATARAITLPKLEAGYHYQAILGQRYQGFHVGTSIPLWENKNKVKAQQARLSHAEFQLQEHRIEHRSQNYQKYQQYLHWKNTTAEYQELLQTSNNQDLLTKALEHGEISLIEYLMEVRYFYDAVEKNLYAERELQKSIALLTKYQL